LTRQSMMTSRACKPYGFHSPRRFMDARVKPGHDAECGARLFHNACCGDTTA